MANKSQILSDGHKEKIRSQIISGARNYKKQLMDKVFLIVCEDGIEYEVRFFKGDYKHLTGMEERLDRERIEVLFEAIQSLMENMKISAEQAMEAMNVSAEDKAILIKKF